MSSYDLLTAVQPSEGWFAVVGLGGSFPRQSLVRTRAQLEAEASQMVSEGLNVFFGVAKYASADNRTKDNVQALRSFWIDVDCGPDKPYVDQEDGLRAFRSFCTKVNLPKPTIVDSGRGWHIYWPLEEDISRAEWELTAEHLHAACKAHGFEPDPNCFEVARILRLPGTYNFKYEEALEVSVFTAGEPISYDAFHELVSGYTAPKRDFKLPAVKRPLSALQQSLEENRPFENRFERIMQEQRCAQIIDCIKNRETLSEPRWFDVLSVAKFCVDAEEAIQVVSAGHPGYDPDTVVRKIEHIAGPHTCAVFDKNNPGVCNKCPIRGKYSSPITLGQSPKAAFEAEVEVETEEGEIIIEKHSLPPLPEPFQWSGRAVVLSPQGEEIDPVMVYEHPLYVTARLKDPELGEVASLHVDTDHDGSKEFMVPLAKLADMSEVRKLLAGEGIIVSSKRQSLLSEFLIKSVQQDQNNRKAGVMRTQFGWADKDSKFILGNREISAVKTEVIPSPPAVTSLSAPLHVKGDFEKWKEVMMLYDTPGLEPQAFGVLAAISAPLIKFSGLNGAIINLMHPGSGGGKTTVLRVASSFWGDPAKLVWNPKDTVNIRTHKIGVHNNLPCFYDEMTNTTPHEMSNLAYELTAGKGKDRMKASANEMRANNTTWQTLAVTTSNRSFYEILTSFRSLPEGEMMRIMEYKVGLNNILDLDRATEMFDRVLAENYGHGGEIYARWLVQNQERAKNMWANMEKHVRNQFNFTQPERNWAALVTSAFTAWQICRHIGLFAYDGNRLIAWANGMINELRNDVKAIDVPAHGYLGEFLNSNVSNMLVISGLADNRTGFEALADHLPRGKLIVRAEPDTNMIYISAREFRAWCGEHQLNHSEIIKDLTRAGLYKGTEFKRLAKGTKLPSNPVQALVIDGTDTELLANLVIEDED